MDAMIPDEDAMNTTMPNAVQNRLTRPKNAPMLMQTSDLVSAKKPKFGQGISAARSIENFSNQLR